MNPGGIVLCGVPFGSETMLQRVVRLLGTVVSPLVGVAALEQALPELTASVTITCDEREGRGPLEGLRAGFKVAIKMSPYG